MAHSAGHSIEVGASHALDCGAVIPGETGERFHLWSLPGLARHEDALELRPVGADGFANGLQAADHSLASARLPIARVQRALFLERASSTSRCKTVAAERGSAASRMGLPTTTQSAPRLIAAAA